MPTTSTKAAAGQEATQVPLERKGVDPLVQVRHWLAFGPEHVPHAASQGSQTLLEFAYLPTVEHESRQLPNEGSGLKNGVAAGQFVQALDDGPAQVAQLSWHVTHVSAAEDEPPAHV